jgi:hypothetical protein
MKQRQTSNAGDRRITRNELESLNTALLILLVALSGVLFWLAIYP